jgi:membrane-bound serine protease (ClpP class)
MKKILFCLYLFLLFTHGLSDAKQNTGYMLNVDSAIGPITYYQIKNILTLARRNDADFVILTIDTPGGLLSSTRKIVQEILASDIPVIGFVHPKGSQCASAGVFIALSCHIIAMSPATNIGAAHPVNLGGKQDEIMEEKVINDTVSFIKSIARHRGRNTKWAEKSVRESISSTETEALNERVIDVIANDTGELLTAIDGKTIKINDREKVLNTKDARLLTPRESFKERVLKIIANPNIAYILLTLGTLGILMELYNPGLGIPGIVGTVSLILAFFALHTLSINVSGLLLIAVSFVFFAIEAVTPSFGLFIISGIITLTLGSFFLFRPMSDIKIPNTLIVGVVTTVGIILWLAIWFLWRTKSRKITTGKEGLLGEKARVVKTLNPEGTVFIQGEYWKARSETGEIPKDATVVVNAYDGFTLIVKESEHDGTEVKS